MDIDALLRLRECQPQREIRPPLFEAQLFAQLTSLRKATNLLVRNSSSGAEFFSKRDWALTPTKPLRVSQIDRAKTGSSVPLKEWLSVDEQAVGNKLRGLHGWALSIGKQAGFGAK